MIRYVPISTSDGTKYRVLEPTDKKMRVPTPHVNSALYVYESEQSLKSGQASGGSDFFVGIMAADRKGWYIYAVTNNHVIAMCSEFPIIRFNKAGGGTYTMSTSKDAWVPHPDGDDLRVCQLFGLPEDSEIGWMTPEEFVTPENLKPDNYNIGPGDNTYMIGRFPNHEGNESITPIVRYGNISLNPADNRRVYNNETKHDDEVFLIESRSISGYSGSAVFVYIQQFDNRNPDVPTTNLILSPDRMTSRPFFLGINIGHTRIMKPVVIPKPPKPYEYQDIQLYNQPLLSEYNSGIMRISPAWKLKEILDMEVFAESKVKEYIRAPHLMGEYICIIFTNIL